MDVREAAARQQEVGGDDASTTRMGAVALPIGVVLIAISLFLFGLAIALGRVNPRWMGLIAVISGAALMYDGAVVVAYGGFVPDIVKLVGLLLLAVWAFVMAALMWRNGSRRRSARLEPPSQAAAQRPASMR